MTFLALLVDILSGCGEEASIIVGMDSDTAIDTGDTGSDTGSETGTDTGNDDTQDTGGDTATDSRDTETGGDSDSETGGEEWAYTVCDDGTAPFVAIQDAIDAASEGDVITICDGRYVESLIIPLGLTLEAGDIPGDVTLDGDGSGPAISASGVVGLTIRGIDIVGGEGDGGALQASASEVVLQDVGVYDNKSTLGTLFLDGGSLTLVDLSVHDNSSDYASGVNVIDAVLTVDHAAFFSNTTTGGRYVGAFERSSTEMTNVLFYDNDVNTTLAAEGGDLVVINAVVSVPATGISATGDALVQNVIFFAWGGWSSSSVGVAGGADLAISYSMFSDLTNDWYDGAWHTANGSEGNLHADPAFVDDSIGDFTLEPFSPAVDAGNPAASMSDVDGSRNDMGAYGGPAGLW